MIDAHAHFWDRGVFAYPWLEGSPLPDRYLPEDLDADRSAGDTAVFVQAEIDGSGVSEARWVSEHTGAHPWIVGIVAFAPIGDRPCSPELEQLLEVDRVVGVRRVLQDTPGSFIESPEFRAGLEEVSRVGLTFDACIRSWQLPALTGALSSSGSPQVVLDHLGKPPLRSGTDGFTRWHSDLRALAKRSNVTVKLSGLPAETDATARDDDFGPWLRAAVDLFGPRRCMVGSDWPVSRRGGSSRARWFDVVREQTGLAGDEWDQVAHGTASRIYGLP